MPAKASKETDTEHVLFAGALWLVPAATLTVMVALPLALPVTVTVLPLTETVAMLVLLELALIVPSPVLVTTICLLGSRELSAMLDTFRLKDPAAFPIDQETVLAALDPSGHW